MTDTDDDSDGLRSQGRRTRARLLDAGMAVLAERGFQAARVDDIVRTAGVSHGTFYLYFTNKEELLKALAARCADEMTAVIGGLGPVGSGPAGRATVRAWLGDFVETYQRYGVVIRAWMEGTVADRELARLGVATFGAVSATLVEQIRAAAPAEAPSPELAAAALLALVERNTYYLVSRGAEVDPAVLDSVAAVVHRGWFGGTVPRRGARSAARSD